MNPAHVLMRQACEQSNAKNKLLNVCLFRDDLLPSQQDGKSKTVKEIKLPGSWWFPDGILRQRKRRCLESIGHPALDPGIRP